MRTVPHTGSTLPRLVPVTEAADRLGIHRATFWYQVHMGKIPGVVTTTSGRVVGLLPRELERLKRRRDAEKGRPRRSA
jgi:hypothetical protein